jgi:hypothetical protein
MIPENQAAIIQAASHWAVYLTSSGISPTKRSRANLLKSHSPGNLDVLSQHFTKSYEAIAKQLKSLGIPS